MRTSQHPGASTSAQAKHIKEASVDALQVNEGPAAATQRAAGAEEDKIVIEQDCLRFLWYWRNIAHSPRTICDSLAPRRSLSAITEAVQRLAARGFVVVNVQRETPEDTFWGVKYPDLLEHPREANAPAETPRPEDNPKEAESPERARLRNSAPMNAAEKKKLADSLWSEVLPLGDTTLEVRAMTALTCAYIRWQPESDSEPDRGEADEVAWLLWNFGKRLADRTDQIATLLADARRALK